MLCMIDNIPHNISGYIPHLVWDYVYDCSSLVDGFKLNYIK